jgi:hypothetical protein
VSRRLATLAITALCTTAAPAVAQSATPWRSMEVSRQLRDTLPQRIRVRYGAGKVVVRGSSAPLLYAMRLRYDESRSAPLHQYDAEQRSAVLGLESRGTGLRASNERSETGELMLALPRSVPLDLSFELGGTQSELELGGLSLHSLRLECGATDATLRFTTPNGARMREMEIDVGAADFMAQHLANANAENLRLRGGVGVVDLDFSGAWTQDMNVSARLAIGQLILRVPADVGVRLEVQRVAAGFEHPGLVERDDAWYSDNWETASHKLRVRAETFFGKIDVRRAMR